MRLMAPREAHGTMVCERSSTGKAAGTLGIGPCCNGSCRRQMHHGTHLGVYHAILRGRDDLEALPGRSDRPRITRLAASAGRPDAQRSLRHRDIRKARCQSATGLVRDRDGLSDPSTGGDRDRTCVSAHAIDDAHCALSSFSVWAAGSFAGLAGVAADSRPRSATPGSGAGSVAQRRDRASPQRRRDDKAPPRHGSQQTPC